VSDIARDQPMAGDVPDELCVAEALQRVVAVRDLVDMVLWAEAPPLRAIELAISGLTNARNMFKSAGFEEAAR
jgi:hypothetical protein